MSSTFQPGRYSFVNQPQVTQPQDIYYNTDTAGRRPHLHPHAQLFTGQLPPTPQPPLIAANVIVFAPRIVFKPAPPLIGPTGTPRAPATARRIFKPPTIGPTNTPFVPIAYKANAVIPLTFGPTGTLFAPTKVKTVKVYAPFIGPTSQEFAPKFKVSAVKPPRLGPSGTPFAPQIPRKIQMPFIDMHLALTTGLWNATDVKWDDSSITWDGNRVGTGVPIFPPKIGAAPRLPPRIANNAVPFAPTVVAAAATNFIGPTNHLFGPVMLTYARPPSLGPSGTTFAHSVTPSKGVPLLASNLTLFAPKATQVTRPPLIAQTQLFEPFRTTLTVHVGGAAAPIFDDTLVIFDAPGVSFDAASGSSIGPTGVTFAPFVSVSGVLKPAPFIDSTGLLFAPAMRGIALPPVLGPTSVLFAPTEISYRVTAGFVGSTITIFAPTKTTAAFMPLIIDTVSLFAPLVTVPTPSTAAMAIKTGHPELKWQHGAVTVKWKVGRPQRKWRTE